MHNKNQVFKKIVFPVLLFGALALLLPLAAHAIPMNELNTAAGNANLPRYGSFREILETVLKILLSLAFLLALIYVVISGYRYITSAGNEEAVERAKRNLFWSIAGMAVIIFAWIILNVVFDLVATGSAGNLPANNGP